MNPCASTTDARSVVILLVSVIAGGAGVANCPKRFDRDLVAKVRLNVKDAFEHGNWLPPIAVSPDGRRNAFHIVPNGFSNANLPCAIAVPGAGDDARVDWRGRARGRGGAATARGAVASQVKGGGVFDAGVEGDE